MAGTATLVSQNLHNISVLEFGARADPGFSFKGERKGLCERRHITNAKIEGRGSGHGSSIGFSALSCYLSLIFKHSDTNWD